MSICRDKTDHNTKANYDDVNELFWRPDVLDSVQRGCNPENTIAQLFKPDKVLKSYTELRGVFHGAVANTRVLCFYFVSVIFHGSIAVVPVAREFFPERTGVAC